MAMGSKKLPPGPERDQVVCNVLSKLIGREVRPWTDDVSYFGAPGGFGPAVAPNLEFLPSLKSNKEYRSALSRSRGILSATLFLRSVMRELTKEDTDKINELIKLLDGQNISNSDRKNLLGIVNTFGTIETIELSSAILAIAAGARVDLLEAEIAAFAPKRPSGGSYPADLRAEQVVYRLSIWFRIATGEIPAAAFHGVHPSNPFSRAVAEILEELDLPRANARQVGRACVACADFFEMVSRTLGDTPSP